MFTFITEENQADMPAKCQRPAQSGDIFRAMKTNINEYRGNFTLYTYNYHTDINSLSFMYDVFDRVRAHLFLTHMMGYLYQIVTKHLIPRSPQISTILTMSEFMVDETDGEDKAENGKRQICNGS